MTVAAETKAVATKGFATHGPEAKFEPFEFTRREVGPNDILIDIQYCGICHSGIHQARDEWHDLMPASYPMVPGHEIVGRVSQVGSELSKFKECDFAGIGCFVDSCRVCPACTGGIQQYCICVTGNHDRTRFGNDLWRIPRTEHFYTTSHAAFTHVQYASIQR